MIYNVKLTKKKLLTNHTCDSFSYSEYVVFDKVIECDCFKELYDIITKWCNSVFITKWYNSVLYKNAEQHTQNCLLFMSYEGNTSNGVFNCTNTYAYEHKLYDGAELIYIINYDKIE